MAPFMPSTTCLTMEWNAMERQGLPVLVSCGKAKVALGGAENGSRRENCNSVDQRMAAGCTLIQKPGTKMEIPDNCSGESIDAL
jgi:hypothetical protein